MPASDRLAAPAAGAWAPAPDDGRRHAGREARRTSRAPPSGCSACCGPQRLLVGVVLLFGVASVSLSVLGPKLLGHATDIIFDGVVGRSCRPASPRPRRSRELRAQGDTTPGRHAGRDERRARAGHRLHPARAAAAWVAGRLRGRVAVRAAAGPADRDGGAARRCTGCASRSRRSCPGCR